VNKLVFDTPKGPALLCVLEPGNVHALTHGEPIEFSLNEEGMWPKGLPAKLTIGILYSETPVADAREIQKLLKPTSKMTDLRTPKVEATRPHCPQCRSTIEQMGVMRNESPIWLVFCVQCGCTLGAIPPQGGLAKR
jgi:Zn ribbon nucleic-acid-binding protein